MNSNIRSMKIFNSRSNARAHLVHIDIATRPFSKMKHNTYASVALDFVAQVNPIQ